jgi:hypothetical protein
MDLGRTYRGARTEYPEEPDSTLLSASSPVPINYQYTFFGAVPSVSDIEILNYTLNVRGVFKYGGIRDAVVDV